MGDDRLRALERAWASSREDAAALAYLHELERTGGSELEIRRVKGRWGIAGSYSAESIVAEFDRVALEKWEVFMLDNGYIFPIDVRLSAYRDEHSWAVIVEQLGWFTRMGDVEDGVGIEVTCFGNFSWTGREGELIAREFVERIHEEDLEEGWRISQQATALRIRGEEVPIPPGTRGQGVEVLLRTLLETHRGALLATEKELQAILGQDLPLFLRLREWRHPVLPDQRPSQVETFPLLAKALAAGRPEVYAPTQSPNTHWSNWPEGGSL